MLDLKAIARDFYKREIRPHIDAHGKDSGLQCKNKSILFYAGPSPEITEKLYGKRYISRNWKLAAQLAKKLHAGRIDEVDVFAYLMGGQFENDVMSAYGLSGTELKSVIQEIWYIVCAKFARTEFQEASTLVCGAEGKSSFRQKEMRHMLAGDHLMIVNKHLAQLFRDFRDIDSDKQASDHELFRLDQITMLLQLKKRAKETGYKSAWDFYRRQRRYFLEHEKEYFAAFRSLPAAKQAEIRQKRKEILAQYKTASATKALEDTLKALAPAVTTPKRRHLKIVARPIP